ncbi:MAG: TIGR03087 family PEP-CTERM/XrtA system glycosyltransferase [Anaerolineales bacterium]
MPLLALTARLPYPPDRGDRLRAYHFLRTLSREHEITLLSFIAAEEERANIPPLQEICARVEVVHLPAWRSALNVALHLWRPDPLQVLYYRSAAMQSLVARTLAESRFDAVYVHLFRMAQFVDWTTDNGPGNQATRQPDDHPTRHLPHRILDLTDVISKEITRSLPYRGTLSKWLYAIERPRIARYEVRMAHTFEEAWLISPADRDLLAQRATQANLHVVTNGVDTETLHPTGETPQPNSLLFVGHLRVFHNMDAAEVLARQVLPLVRREIPGASLTLVGADPHPKIRALESLEGVRVAGFVPDLNAALNQAAIFVAPLRFAAGVQNKVLEAMAAGRPVVTTTIVNEGLGAQPETHLLLADTPAETARQVIRLLREPALAARLGQAARAFVQKRFSWQGALRRVTHIRDIAHRDTEHTEFP